MIGGNLTRRYVQPLFEVAREHGILDRVGEELTHIHRTLIEHPELKSYLYDPTIERQVKRDIVVKVFVDTSQYTLNFLKVVLDKKRPEVLSESLRVYTDMLNEHRGIRPGVIETAVPIDAATIGKIESNLAATFGGKLKLESKLNPELVGGIRVRVGNTVIDGSVQGRLEKLKQLLSI